jgi:hypothetical protein
MGTGDRVHVYCYHVVGHIILPYAPRVQLQRGIETGELRPEPGTCVSATCV